MRATAVLTWLLAWTACSPAGNLSHDEDAPSERCVEYQESEPYYLGDCCRGTPAAYPCYISDYVCRDGEWEPIDMHCDCPHDCYGEADVDTPDVGDADDGAGDAEDDVPDIEDAADDDEVGGESDDVSDTAEVDTLDIDDGQDGTSDANHFDVGREHDVATD